MDTGRIDSVVEPATFDEELRAALFAAEAVSEADFARAKRIRGEQDGDEPLSALLVRMGFVSERAMAEALAQASGLPLIRNTDYAEEALVADVLSPRFLKEHGVVPIAFDEGALRLAMADPQRQVAVRAIELATSLPVLPAIGVSSEIQAAIDRLYAFETSARAVEGAGHGDELNRTDVDQLRDMASEAPVVRLVNQVIQRAVDSRASDIHIEPFERVLKIRFRIDGVLRDEPSPPRQMGPAMISRIKIMADLDIAERRLPQDGRIKLWVHGQELDLRISTVPTLHGESLVMRLLKREAVDLDFTSLGFSEQLRARMQRALALPDGMIIVTGPTGSGKTTTLYTALHGLNTEERKVITVEDPVEYQLAGINQIQVNAAIGLTFANALSSIVRQDPDVIMVGEMRDLETVRICVQSALTGHLVLSTLHTNDAASSISRLLEMGAEDYLLNSTLNTVLAQRLVRLLCPACKAEYRPDAGIVHEFRLDQLLHGGELRLFHARGCEACGGTGYRGRVGILEMLTMTDTLRALVLRHAGATEIERVARNEGMDTMFEDGCRKALQGITTLEEVIRVAQDS
ncbi:MAG: Flp pilus assembly complex ATPase component TadA [Gammaproteobacteria bacterium]|nr:Flp pilus assembly complex ATPase component TadA [Gammaproteobacteria bacterium]